MEQGELRVYGVIRRYLSPGRSASPCPSHVRRSAVAVALWLISAAIVAGVAAPAALAAAPKVDAFRANTTQLYSCQPGPSTCSSSGGALDTWRGMARRTSPSRNPTARAAGLKNVYIGAHSAIQWGAVMAGGGFGATELLGAIPVLGDIAQFVGVGVGWLGEQLNKCGHDAWDLAKSYKKSFKSGTWRPACHVDIGVVAIPPIRFIPDGWISRHTSHIGSFGKDPR